MPIYEYECKQCETISESLESYTVTSIECPNCDVGVAHKIMSSPVGRVEGGVPKLTTSKIDKNVSHSSKSK